MIRVLLSVGQKAYGYDITGYEDQKSESGYYDDWCNENEYELVKSDNNN